MFLKISIVVTLLYSYSSIAQEQFETHFKACENLTISSECVESNSSSIKTLLQDWGSIEQKQSTQIAKSFVFQSTELIEKVDSQIRAHILKEKESNDQLIACLKSTHKSKKCKIRIMALKMLVEKMWPLMEESLLIGFGNVSYHGKKHETKILTHRQSHPISEFGELPLLSIDKRRMLSPKVSFYSKPEDKKKYQQEYYKIVSKLPMLGYLKSEVPTDQELISVIQKFTNNSQKLLEKELAPSDLITFEPIIEDILTQSPQYCSSAELWRKEVLAVNSSREKKQLFLELGVAGGCLAAGFASFGMAAPLCFSLGAGFAGYSYIDSMSKEKMIGLRAFSSLDNNQFVENLEELKLAEAQLRLQQLLLPLEAFGIGDVLSETKNLIPTKSSISYTRRLANSLIGQNKKIVSQVQYNRKIKSTQVSKELMATLLKIKDPTMRSNLLNSLEDMPAHTLKYLQRMDDKFFESLKTCN